MLKSWIDYIVRPGFTFARAPGWPGLLEDRPLDLLIAARDEYDPEKLDWLDTLTPVTQRAFAFMGISDVRSLVAGGSLGVNRGDVILADHLAKFEAAVIQAARTDTKPASPPCSGSFEQRFFPVPLHLPGEAPSARSLARVGPGEQIIQTSALLPPVTNEQRVGFNRLTCILCEQEIAQVIAELCDLEGPIPQRVLEELPAMIFGTHGNWAIYELSLQVSERNWTQWQPGSDTPARL